MANRLRGVFSIIILLLLPTSPVSAQSLAYANLGNLNTDNFPRINAMLEVHDSQGNFIHGIQPNQVSILESGQPAPVTNLEEKTTGVQVVFAINPGPAFGIRNNQAISRYDRLKENLINWANSRMGSTIDDLSLIITNGPSISHNNNPRELLDTLNSDQVNPRNAVPNIDTLFHAVRLAGDQPVHSGMGRTVLFITTSPEDQIDQSLQNLFVQAKEQKIPINVWMISSSGTYISQSDKELISLVESTGGKFYTFSDEEELPNLEEYLEPLRHIYYLEYESNIRSSGTYEIFASIQTGTEVIETDLEILEINIQPPKPAFISPPIQIVVNPNPTEVDSTTDTQSAQEGKYNASSNDQTSNNLPSQQILQVVFDFPDGRKRPLVETSLIVDGKVVEENLQPPFDQFTWSLNDYTSNEVHLIKVRAKDTLGLTGESIEIPVTVEVIEFIKEPPNQIDKNLPLILGLSALLAGSIVTSTLILRRKLQPKTVKSSHSRKRHTLRIQQSSDVQSDSTSGLFTSLIKKKQHFPLPRGSTSNAYLVFVADSEEFPTAPPIPITADEMTIGSGHGQAVLQLDDPSIETIHAKISRRKDGLYYLSDEGSVAGSWINYHPASREGNKLEHGDLIYIGRVGFRFLLRKPSQTRRPVLSGDNEGESSIKGEDS